MQSQTITGSVETGEKHAHVHTTEEPVPEAAAETIATARAGNFIINKSFTKYKGISNLRPSSRLLQSFTQFHQVSVAFSRFLVTRLIDGYNQGIA